MVVLGLAIGGWFLFGGGKGVKEVSAPSGVGEEAAAPEEKGFTGKLKDALSLGQSMKCTWKQDESNYSTSYIKGDKVYTEGTYAGQKMYSIMADNCVYSWQEGQAEGFKICYEPGQMEEMRESATGEEGTVPGRYSGATPDVDYSCVPAVVSDAKFNPPSNITFASLEENMKQMMTPQ